MTIQLLARSCEKRYHLFPFVWVSFSEVPLTDFKTPAKIASWLTRDPAFYLRLLFRTFLAKMWNRLVTTFQKVWILFCLNLSSWSLGESTMKLVKACCNLMIKIYDSATSLNFTNYRGEEVKVILLFLYLWQCPTSYGFWGDFTYFMQWHCHGALPLSVSGFRRHSWLSLFPFCTLSLYFSVLSNQYFSNVLPQDKKKVVWYFLCLKKWIKILLHWSVSDSKNHRATTVQEVRQQTFS